MLHGNASYGRVSGAVFFVRLPTSVFLIPASPRAARRRPLEPSLTSHQSLLGLLDKNRIAPTLLETDRFQDTHEFRVALRYQRL